MELHDRKKFVTAITSGHLEDLKGMIREVGVEECLPFLTGCSGLFSSVSLNHVPITKYIIDTFCKQSKEGNRDLGYLDEEDCYNLLHTACTNDSLETLVYLLSVFGSYYLTEYGDDMLHVACLSGSMRCGEYLLSKGATVLCMEESGKFSEDTLYMVALRGNMDMVEFLIDKKATGPEKIHPWVLGLCARSGSLNVVKKIVRECKINLSEDNGWWQTSALSVASKYGNLDVVIWMVKNGSINTHIACMEAFYAKQMNVCLYLTSLQARVIPDSTVWSFPEYPNLVYLLLGFFKRQFQFSKDVLFEEKLGMVVGLYL